MQSKPFALAMPLSADDLSHAAAVVEALFEDLLTTTPTLEGLSDEEEDALLPLAEAEALGDVLELLQGLAAQASAGEG